MSFTRTVPAVVPSDFQSSVPPAKSVATKYNVPFAFVRLLGIEPTPPALMSLTITVPVAVPSDFHNSIPLETFVAVKNNVPFTFVK